MIQILQVNFHDPGTLPERIHKKWVDQRSHTGPLPAPKLIDSDRVDIVGKNQRKLF